jgi:hypothetical protein
MSKVTDTILKSDEKNKKVAETAITQVIDKSDIV